MTPHDVPPPPDHVRAFVEELLRTGIVLSGLIADLLDDLPDDAFPGEEPAEVLLEMLSGTVQPVAQAAGTAATKAATQLIGAAADRVLGDLRAVAGLPADRRRA